MAWVLEGAYPRGPTARVGSSGHLLACHHPSQLRQATQSRVTQMFRSTSRPLGAALPGSCGRGGGRQAGVLCRPLRWHLLPQRLLLQVLAVPCTAGSGATTSSSSGSTVPRISNSGAAANQRSSSKQGKASLTSSSKSSSSSSTRIRSSSHSSRASSSNSISSRACSRCCHSRSSSKAFGALHRPLLHPQPLQLLGVQQQEPRRVRDL